MNTPTRDRNQELVLPRVHRREGEYCAFCGSPVGPSHEAFSRYRYCSRECHLAGRRANQAENNKRKRLRCAPLVQPGKPTRDPKLNRCWKCSEREGKEILLPVTSFYRDSSRKSGLTNICRFCEKRKFAEHYQAKREKIKAKSKARNRAVRSQSQGTVPDGIALSARQLRRATENLRAILAEMPETAPAALLTALYEGRVNGQVFEDRGGCGCLWGTMGRALGWSIAEEGAWAKRFRQRWCAEIDLFGAIVPGDTPDTNPYAAICAAVLKGE